MGVETGVIANGSSAPCPAATCFQRWRRSARTSGSLPAPPGRYEVQVVERASFWRKQVLIQRFHRGQRKWLLVKKLRLVNSDAAPGSSFVWSTTDEFADVAKGTTTVVLYARASQALPHRRLQQPAGDEVRRSAWIAAALVTAALSLGLPAPPTRRSRGASVRCSSAGTSSSPPADDRERPAAS